MLRLKKIEVSKYFFCTHIFATVVPTFYFNYPFIRDTFASENIGDGFSKIVYIHRAFTIYIVVQILLFIYLLFRLVRGTKQEKLHTTTASMQ
jgi:hypothetical protein